MAFWNRKRAKPRRVDRLRAEGDLSWHQRLRSRQSLSRLAILAGFFVGALLIIQLPRRPLPHRVGDRITEPVWSKADFESVDREATRQARQLVALRIPGVYEPDPRGLVEARQGLLELVQAVADAAALPDVPQPVRNTWPVDEPMFTALKMALGEESQALDAVKQQVQAALADLADPLRLPVLRPEAFQNELARLQDLKEVETGLVPGIPPDIVMGGPERVEAIRISGGGGEDDLRTVPLDQVLVLRPSERPELESRVAARLGEPLGEVFGPAGVRRLAGPVAERIGATLSYAETLSKNRRQEAADGVEPIRRRHKKGTTLVDASPVKPTVITEAHRHLLQQAQEAYWAELGLFRRALIWIGVAALVGLMAVLVAVYARLFRPEVARSVPRVFVLAVLCLLVLGASKALVNATWSFAWWTLLLTTMAMTVTIAYSERFALAVTAAMVMLVAIATGSGFDWTITALLGTSVAILALGEINNRSKLIKVGALAGLAFFLTANGLWVWRLAESAPGGPADQVMASLFSFASGVAAGFVMLGLLPFIERAFGIVTNISLLELCDVNQPALRRLAIEAPGTYQHSLLIGTLAEAAAEAIGANGLLARVGAYFHDIGKVNKPRYYVENWQEEGGTHENLTPQMSRLVITSHVKDGLEMADRLGLPPVIKRFITEHHGTTLVEYFYREAERQQAEGGGEAPAEEDYRYPGPIPQSPETGVVMLADAVEGATRSLREPTPAKIRATVHEMIMKRLLDGQLDASGLTLRDLHRAEETLTKTLVSVYHGRVPYPSEKAAEETEQEVEEEPPPAEEAPAGAEDDPGEEPSPS